MFAALRAAGIAEQPAPRQPTVAETMAIMVNRVKGASTLADRRAALKELGECNRKDLLEIGAPGMAALMQVLKGNKFDPTIAEGVLVMLGELIEGSNASKETFLGAFAEHEAEFKGIETLLGVFEEHSFHSKLNVLQFLTKLVEYHPETLPAFSNSNHGLHLLVSVLNSTDNEGILRNEALLLMKALAIGGEEVQKVLVYENIFESLLKIVTGEGGVQGGVVVEDCLEILHHLLATNYSNQKNFRDLVGFTKLLPLLEFDASVTLTESGNKIVTLIIYLLIYFLRNPDAADRTRTIRAIAGIEGENDVVTAEHSLLNALAGVSLHTAPGTDIHTEALKCLKIIAMDSETIRAHLLMLVVERDGGLYKWINCLAERVSDPGNDPKRLFAAAELFSILASTPELRSQLGAGAVGEACTQKQPHPTKTLLKGLFNTTTRPAAYYASCLLRPILAAPGVLPHLSTSSYNSTPLLTALISTLRAAICGRDGGGAGGVFHVQALFRIVLPWLSGSPDACVAFAANHATDIGFFVDTANADGIEPVSTQVQCIMVLGLALVGLPPGANDQVRRALRDAMQRRVGLEQFATRYAQLRNEQEFASAAGPFSSGTPEAWDTDMRDVVEAAYEHIQQGLLAVMSEPLPSSRAASPTQAPGGMMNGNGHGEGAYSPEGDESMRQLAKQQQRDIEAMREELNRTRQELTQARATPSGAIESGEAAIRLKREYLAKEEEWHLRLMEAEDKARLLQMEVDEERARRQEDGKLSDIQKRITEENIAAVGEARKVLEEENESLLSTLQALETRLDAADSKLGIVSQLVSDDAALKAAMEAAGAMRYLDGAYIPQGLNGSFGDRNKSSGNASSNAALEAKDKECEALRAQLAQLDEDQNDLYALLGEYDERIKTLLAERAGGI
eukprot:TRINITY_DN7640_c1_g3_i1.p1 TRINITY_DN7640_c1_g3~~TRINITY_DN7640_c1_g3_i1.p1  ORF type:complete len:905 (+),score=350.21 TRINITY_DN7640_c1_g3_i1:147-2861(+)